MGIEQGPFGPEMPAAEPSEEMILRQFEEKLTTGEIVPGVSLETLNSFARSLQRSGKSLSLASVIGLHESSRDNPLEPIHLRQIGVKGRDELDRWFGYLRFVDDHFPTGVPAGWFRLQREKKSRLRLGKTLADGKILDWEFPRLWDDLVPAAFDRLEIGKPSDTRHRIVVSPQALGKAHREQALVRTYYGIEVDVQDRESFHHMAFEDYLIQGKARFQSLPEGPVKRKKLAALLRSTGFFHYYQINPYAREGEIRPDVSVTTAQRYIELVMGVYEREIEEKQKDPRKIFEEYYFNDLRSTRAPLTLTYGISPSRISAILQETTGRLKGLLARYRPIPITKTDTQLTDERFLPQDQPRTVTSRIRKRIPLQDVLPDEQIVRHIKGGMASVEREETIPLSTLLNDPKTHPDIAIHIAVGPDGEKRLALKI